MTEFMNDETTSSVNFDYISKNIKLFFSDYKFSKIELLLFILLILINVRNKSANFAIISIFIVNTLIVNFRFNESYYIFYIFVYLILFAEMLKKLNDQLSIRFTYIALVIFCINSINFLFLSKNNFFDQIIYRENNMLKICNQYKLGNKEAVEFIKYWHNKIDDIKIKKICNEMV